LTLFVCASARAGGGEPFPDARWVKASLREWDLSDGPIRIRGSKSNELSPRPRNVLASGDEGLGRRGFDRRDRTDLLFDLARHPSFNEAFSLSRSMHVDINESDDARVRSTHFVSLGRIEPFKSPPRPFKRHSRPPALRHCTAEEWLSTTALIPTRRTAAGSFDQDDRCAR